MSRNTRIQAALKATGIVAAISAIGGALGGFAIGTGILIYDFIRFKDFLPDALDNMVTFVQISGVTIAFGALYGVVLGPLYAWTMLRRAPLWRAIGETAAAAAVGVGLGMFTHWTYSAFVLPVLLSFAAAVRLHLELRHRPEAAKSLRANGLDDGVDVSPAMSHDYVQRSRSPQPSTERARREP